jgi:hypothetical protein
MFVGAEIRGALVRPAGALWQVEDGAPTLQPLVSWRCVGTVFAALTADRDNQYLMIDSTIVRAHQQAATGKGRLKTKRWGVPEAD